MSLGTSTTIPADVARLLRASRKVEVSNSTQHYRARPGRIRASVIWCNALKGCGFIGTVKMRTEKRTSRKAVAAGLTPLDFLVTSVGLPIPPECATPHLH